MRKMASIRRITDIRPIPDADAIECASVGGWNVVVKKGEYQVGDLTVYSEIDSWIPNVIAPFLSKGQEPRVYEGITGERLRTVKLRGQISQGLLLPMSFLNGHTANEGDDVSDILGIIKWDAPIPAQLAGQVKGNFPGIISKTDQERIQNFNNEINDWREAGDIWEITEKLDGSSMTCFFLDGEFGVCSRNLELRETADNTLWKTARAMNLEDHLRRLNRNIAFQFELIGEGIQKNSYKLKGHSARLFDIYDIATGRYMLPDERYELIEKIDTVVHTPIINTRAIIGNSVAELIAMADGKSMLNDQTDREGFVYKNVNKNVSFKVISNKFLIKHQD